MGTQNDLVFHTGSGHAAWESALVNLFSPGDLLFYPQTGNFSDRWGQMARDLGLRTSVLECDWRRGVEISAVRAALAADTAHEIKAVCVTHNETSTGMTLDPADFRAALDATGHPALLLVDTISSLGCMDFRNDEWLVDCAVGGSQKGLMLPTGLSFNTISQKAWAASKQSTMPKSYFSLGQHDEAAAQELHGHAADLAVLRPQGIAPPDDGGRGAGERVRPPHPAGDGGALRGEPVGRQWRAATALPQSGTLFRFGHHRAGAGRLRPPTRSARSHSTASTSRSAAACPGWPARRSASAISATSTSR